MKDAQKPDHVSLNALVQRLKDGRFVIPDFQREFEWKPWDIRELMRSIFLDYYIGSLLLWRGKRESFEALSCEPIYGHDGPYDREHIVLDGQQRLTAMYYAFMAPNYNLPDRKSRAFYYIHIDNFMAEEYDKAFGYDWYSRWWERYLADDNAQFEKHFFPLGVIGRGLFALPNWLQGYEQFWRRRASEAESVEDVKGAQAAIVHAENAKLFGEHVAGIYELYQIAFVELDQDLTVDKVCDIFTQVNSRGVRLDVFDLMNALLRPKGVKLKEMWREAAPRLSFVESDRMNVYILQVMSIHRMAYCSPKYLYYLLPGQQRPIRDPDGTRRSEVMVEDVDDFKRRWTDAVNALERAIQLLRSPHEFGVSSSAYLPYATILPIFAAIQHRSRSLVPERRLQAQTKIRHWYWASVFTNRYSGSVESTSARDYQDVVAWLEDDDAGPALIGEFKSTFKSIDLRNEIKSGTSVYNGIFNLFVLQGAKDWITGTVPPADELDDHHVVPVAWARDNLPEKWLVNSILNRTPLTADTNRQIISDRLPNQYLPELMKSSGEPTVRAILDSHFISPTAQAILLRDPFTSTDFEDFINERQRTLFDAIEDLLIKERLDLPPQLRDLDGRIEQVELGLRDVIVMTLNGDTGRMPSHLIQKANEAIQREAQKNATFNEAEYTSLARKLEFFDLRELQAAITSRVAWATFESRFVNVQSLDTRFNQLADLRNGIRHSRRVDDITRKDGEAAILWFEQVLAK